ncbi:hypothetical protein C8R43DRAFT_956408 [Mycena crocata]|nr:hypothetical protein C8R43DRAFT_956408 [Mycena crocata]
MSFLYDDYVYWGKVAVWVGRAHQQLSNSARIKGNSPVVAEISAIYCLRAKKRPFSTAKTDGIKILIFQTLFPPPIHLGGPGCTATRSECPDAQPPRGTELCSTGVRMATRNGDYAQEKAAGPVRHLCRRAEAGSPVSGSAVHWTEPKVQFKVQKFSNFIEPDLGPNFSQFGAWEGKMGSNPSEPELDREPGSGPRFRKSGCEPDLNRTAATLARMPGGEGGGLISAATLVSLTPDVHPTAVAALRLHAAADLPMVTEPEVKGDARATTGEKMTKQCELSQPMTLSTPRHTHASSRRLSSTALHHAACLRILNSDVLALASSQKPGQAKPWFEKLNQASRLVSAGFGFWLQISEAKPGHEAMA